MADTEMIQEKIAEAVGLVKHDLARAFLSSITSNFIHLVTPNLISRHLFSE